MSVGRVPQQLLQRGIRSVPLEILDDTLPGFDAFDVETVAFRLWLTQLRDFVNSISGGGGVPGGPNMAVQYNNAGAFGGDGNLLWSSGTVTMTFGGAARLSGDMSNATLVNRFALQSSTLNGATRVMALPNGAGTTSAFNASNLSDPTNANFVQIAATAVQGQLNAGQNGAAAALPFQITNNTINAFLLDAAANFLHQRGIGSPVVSKTANYTLLQNDHVVFADCTGGTFTLTLPAANLWAAGSSPTFRIKRTDSSANSVIVAAAGGDTIDGVATKTISALGACDLESNGVAAWGVINTPITGNVTSTFDWGKFIAGQSMWAQG